MAALVSRLSEETGIKRACEVLGYARSSYYRHQQPPTERVATLRPQPAWALSAAEREAVRAVLNSERFQDCAPRQVYAQLLDEGTYYCSVSTMYRILRDHDEVRERRNQKRHPVAPKPQLVATAPNQVWTWDITKLRGPASWTFYYLYVILDLFSRYVVGYLVAEQESARLAEQLLAESFYKQGVLPTQLTVHADRGSAMTSKTVALLLADLGVSQSHSRPYTSNDNPFSEAQFKTLKYRPDYPDRFGSVVDARAWAHPFFHWYNHIHRHSAIGLMTPATVHYGLAEALTAQRQLTLAQAYARHPERFVNGMPQPPQLPAAVWINPPQPCLEMANSEGFSSTSGGSLLKA